jgi:type IV pilus assembly protein PilX
MKIVRRKNNFNRPDSRGLSAARTVRARALHGASARQRGITLVITIILLVILSLIGTLNMRNATVSEQASNSIRTTAVAQQAAELGLQYCESVAMDTSGTVYPTQRLSILNTTLTGTLTAGAWSATQTWATSGSQLFVTSSYFVSTNAAAKALVNGPRCVIQPVSNFAGIGYLVTARGFANDAQINGNGAVTSGAEVWLQSLILQ